MPSVPADVQQVLARLGRRDEGCTVQLLTTEYGVSKYRASLVDGEELFIGHLGRSPTARLEAAMAAADAVAGHLDAPFQMAGYIRTAGGERLIEIDNGRRFMVVPFFPARRASAGDRYTPEEHCRWNMPDALAVFHLAVRRSGADAAGLAYYSAKETLAWALGNLRKATAVESVLAAELKAETVRALALAEQLEASGATTELDRLPLGVIHTDLQPKNLMLGTDGRSMRICDTETMGRGRRIQDLYFLFAGSDDHEKVADWEFVVRALQQYLYMSQLPLDEDERRLLPVELQLNALGHAGWNAQAAAHDNACSEHHADMLRAFTRAATAFADAECVQRAYTLAHCLAGFGPAGGLLHEYAYFFGAACETANEHLQLPPLRPGETGAAIFFNGTFSPPHAGHLQTAELATEAALKAGYAHAQVLFSPCADGYEKRKLGPLAVGTPHRVAMLQCAGCLVDTFESQRDEAAISLQGVRATFVQRLPRGWEPVFLSGADTSKWTWVRPELAVGMHRLIVVNRAGSNEIVEECERGYAARAWPAKLLIARGTDSGRSSTSIRAAASGDGDLEEAVGVPKIAAYIKVKSLYIA